MSADMTLADISEHDWDKDFENQLIPTVWDCADRSYDLWKTYDDEGSARVEAHGVRDGYARRMYGVIGARVRRYVFTESKHGFNKTVWAVYTRAQY